MHMIHLFILPYIYLIFIQVLTGSDKEDDFDYNGVTRRFIGQLITICCACMRMCVYYN